MKTETVCGPAAFASALINGDQSGLTSEDVLALNEWRRRFLEKGQSVVSCGEPFFSWSFWFYDGRYQGGDLIDYETIIH